MSDDTGWSTERIAEQYRAEIVDVLQNSPTLGIDSDTVDIQIYCNYVRIALPEMYAINADNLSAFGAPSVVWVRPFALAELIDGRPRVVIHLALTESWDDDRAAEWERQRPRRSLLDEVLENLEAKSADRPIERVEFSTEMIKSLISEDD